MKIHRDKSLKLRGNASWMFRFAGVTLFHTGPWSEARARAEKLARDRDFSSVNVVNCGNQIR